MQMTLGDFFTVKDVAQKLKVSVGRIHQLITDGRITPVKKIGNYNFFDKESVEKLAKTPRKTGRPKKVS